MQKIIPGSEAETSGVQPGWVFTKVDGVSLDGMDFEKIVHLLDQKSLNLAPASCSVEFEIDGKILKTVSFFKRPLGMIFTYTLPLTVTKVVPGSEAENRGVQSGWVCSKVGDIPLEKMDKKKIISLLLEKSIHLPLY